ncbi:carboxypeptidase-like regulatory domain-containing protein [Methanocrinis sp.]|uniref:carboxypeptidase-like regulatory domain-containing protein n=1 Tax=Methanocrinis sp. TaxID=3101522 RepID=UPI003D10D5EA
MRLISRSTVCILSGFVLIAALCPVVLGADDGAEQEYLPNPFAADRPEWDPYGPGSESGYVPPRASWDPYSPASYDSPQLVSADPFAPDRDLSVGDEVLSANQLYLQSEGMLVTSGQVGLGTPYSLWLYVANWGPFVLYDRGSRVIYSDFVSPGWYRLDRYAETLQSHYYQFNASGLSNGVDLVVSSAGYPTTYGLVGRVVDYYGSGISGARVRISGAEGGVFSTITNALGYYGMDLPSGTYSVTAELEGFAFTSSTGRVWTGTVSAAGTVVGYPAGQTSSSTFDQDEYGWLTGRITDKSGSAIPGARVRIDGLFSVETDEDGGFWVSLSPGWHSITAEASGYKFSTASVRISSGQGSNLDLRGNKVIVIGSGR